MHMICQQLGHRKVIRREAVSSAMVQGHSQVDSNPIRSTREKYFVQPTYKDTQIIFMEGVAHVCCGVCVEVRGQPLEAILIFAFGTVFLI